MKNWREYLLLKKQTLCDAIELMETRREKFALVVDEQQTLLGSITDRDIRRSLLRQVKLEDSVLKVMNPSPCFFSQEMKRAEMQRLMREKNYLHFPVVSSAGTVVGIVLSEEIKHKMDLPNWIILMAGGLGSRLSPLTDQCPKPLLKIGEKPLLETILKGFVSHGFHKFFLSVNYKSEMIEEYFEDGKKWQVEIKYLREDQPLGTAGSLRSLPQRPSDPIIVMNGDLLTNVNHHSILEFHHEHNSLATMCVREYDYQIPYGVVQTKDYQIQALVEKPVHRFFVNAGIYVLNPEVLELIPKNTYFNMTDLFSQLIATNQPTAAFPIHEYWLDIGKIDNFQQANGDFQHIFSNSSES